MKKRQKRKLIKLALTFIKLQLAGNILFYGTLGGSFLFSRLFDWPPILDVAVASILAHILFFIVNKEWIYNKKTSQRKSRQEIRRFILFMGTNYFINLGLIYIFTRFIGVNEFIAQVMAAGFFAVWNFLGFQFWVFETTKHPAITYHSVKKNRKTKDGKK